MEVVCQARTETGAIGTGGPMEGPGVPCPHAVAVTGARCAGASSERVVEVARQACPVAAAGARRLGSSRVAGLPRARCAKQPKHVHVRPCRVAFTGRAVVGARCVPAVKTTG